MTTGGSPYQVPDAINTSITPGVFETEIVTNQATVDIGGVMANVETYNGSIPGPTIRAEVGDTVIVRLINDLPYPTGIHWHGIELHSSADGTPVTQEPAPVGPQPTPSPLSPSGGTHLYKFTVPRAGVFWYHPHHFHSTNRVFRGLYGMLVVTDPAIESPLVVAGTIPDAADTYDVVLSDTTVCKALGSNDAQTYLDPAALADPPEWLDPTAPWPQPGPTPLALCEMSPLDDLGAPGGPVFGAGDVPNIYKNTVGRVNEGQTVLTNGVNVGDRPGTPAAPGNPAGVLSLPVEANQGLRLRMVNCAATRYFRLRLTTPDGDLVPLVRIGGEGGILDAAILEGSGVPLPAGDFDFRYERGEILLPPATRADVVVAIPDLDPGDVLTMWTRDFPRLGGGGGWTQTPTVAVMHFAVTGDAPAPFAITGGFPGGPAGTQLRTAPNLVQPLGAPNGSLLDPMTFGELGSSNADIQLTAGGTAGVDGHQGEFHGTPFTSIAHLPSTRWSRADRTLQLSVTNTSSAQHPFHLHGFSMQPISLSTPGGPNYTWPYTEFRDVIDIPSQHTLTFKILIDDRPLADGVTVGGALGRWLFHCHIFFHAHNGMISDLVVSHPNGQEKPYVEVNGSWAYAPIGMNAERTGTFAHRDGLPITLTSILDDGTPIGSVVPTGPSTWHWTLDTTGMPAQVTYVYIQAQDTNANRDQAPFRLKIGAPDDGSDSGDPHIHTVDGTRYDFQAAGEFTLIEDREGLEVQVRQTPVPTQVPITDDHTGITACVSVNTAVAARVGSHTIAYQPAGDQGELQFYLDGKPSRLTERGLDLDGNVVTRFDADGAAGLRVDYAGHAVVSVSPRFWSAHGIHYMNVAVSHTQAERGLMGRIHPGDWLPRLRNGSDLGPKPPTEAGRHDLVYRVFADSWRLTPKTSLFVYAPGESTDTFTDPKWPRFDSPCELEPPFVIPTAHVLDPIPLDKAKELCSRVTDPDFHADCVADVSATGDREFVRAYEFAQELRRTSVVIRVTSDTARTRWLAPAWFTVQVAALAAQRKPPAGHVRLYVDGKPTSDEVRIDARGRARIRASRLTAGEHSVFATYDGRACEMRASRSPAIAHTVTRRIWTLDLPFARTLLDRLRATTRLTDNIRIPGRG